MAFMPFVVAGDPDFQKSLKFAKKLAKHSDFLEIGFPYSDPLADGPTIQAADSRALASGMTTNKVFSFIKQLKATAAIPVTVLAYANLVLQKGVENFYKQAKASGIEGVLVPDVPFEEAHGFVKAAKKFGIAPIFLVTQTTDAKRLRKILKLAQGYLYLVSVLGVTGSRKQFSQDTTAFIKRVKASTTLPLAIGFGISQPRQAEIFYKAGADGVIVGSALIDEYIKHGEAKALAFAKKFIS